MTAFWRNNSGLGRECTAVNLNRIIQGAFFAIPMDLAHVIVFSLRHPGSPAEASWRTGIILSHLILSSLMALYGFAAWKIRRSKWGAGASLLQAAVPVTLMAVGVAITAIDQRVTTNITPFVLVTMIVGTLFLIRPLHSAILFFSSYAALHFALSAGASPEVILSNRTNGITAAAIGICLSVAMWIHFSVEVRQRRQIEAQSEELERVNRELQNMAFTDSLTGLPNRRFFDQAMARELAAIERGGASASVIEFDLDYFKEINDTCGHAAGDEILRQVAELVSGAIRKSDMFARYGGEEFILLLPGTAQEGAREAAEKLRKRIEEYAFLVDGREVRMTASFGVAELAAYRTVSYYRSVDHALYSAKQLGRNRVVVMEPDEPREMLPGA